MAEPIVTVSRAARETGLPYQTLLRLVAHGRVASVRVAGGPRRVRISAVRAILEERDAD